MKIQKELSKISNDLEKMSRRIQKLTSSIPTGKGKAQKASMPKPVVVRKGKKSGTQTVLDMIKKSKAGIAAGALIKKTGFEDKKIRNILFKAWKGGKSKEWVEEFIRFPSDHSDFSSEEVSTWP